MGTPITALRQTMAARAWGVPQLERHYWRAQAAPCPMLPRRIAECGECHGPVPARLRFGRLRELLRLADRRAPYQVCDRCPLRPGCPLFGNLPGFIIWTPFRDYPTHTAWLDELRAANGEVFLPIIGRNQMRHVRRYLRAARDVWDLAELYALIAWPGSRHRYAVALAKVAQVHYAVADNYPAAHLAGRTEPPWIVPTIFDMTPRLVLLHERAPLCPRCRHEHWPEEPCMRLSEDRLGENARRRLLADLDAEAGYSQAPMWVWRKEQEDELVYRWRRHRTKKFKKDLTDALQSATLRYIEKRKDKP